ncbi:MAG: glycosyltransferase [Syntrophales bacterium]
MIVKNEEKCLARCLDSVKDHVDEIIIIDTGSTDGTIEIAESYGARIYHYPWENDFSKHRNQSLSYATGNWIFQLDADEELFQEDGSMLRDIVRKGKADFYHCRFYDINKDGSVHGVFYLIRLFRNGMGMAYARKVHNQLLTLGRGDYSDIRIKHYGYDLSFAAMEAKHLRTTTLLKDMLAADPEDVYCLYQLCTSYSMHQEPDKAIEYGEMALELRRRKDMKDDYFLTAFHTTAQAYYAVNRLYDVERVSREALALFPNHLDIYHLLASIYFEKQDYEKSREMCHRFLEVQEILKRKPSLMGNTYCHSFTMSNKIYFGLACIHFQEGDIDGADQYFRKGYEYSGKEMEGAEEISRFYLEQRMNEKAQQWLEIAVEAGRREGKAPTILGVQKNKEGVPTISLCMIVKNEEACLGRCLKSVSKYVDEIIIVDTGSTDGTISIAESYGARIYHHPWENDFSRHRNQSISYATGDWIFQLDADEELFPEDGSVMLDIVRKVKADYFHCRFYDMKKDDSVHGVFYLIRLFRNRMGMSYVRKVHNQLQARGVEAYSGIRIRHYGYDLSAEQMEAKHVRTTTLLQETLACDPEDVYSIYQLSASYSMHREFDKAIEYGEMALEIMRRKELKHGIFSTVFYSVAQGYQSLGRMDDAERICLEALDLFPMHMDMCHLLASIYFRKQAMDLCKAMSERYLHIYDAYEKNPLVFGGSYCHSFAKRNEIYFGLALINFLENEFESADAFFMKSFEDAGNSMEKAENICRFYFGKQMNDKALRWLRIAYQVGVSYDKAPAILGEHTGLYMNMGKDFLKHGDLKTAADCLQKAADGGLTKEEQLEKRLLQVSLCWQLETTDELIRSIESLMQIIGLNTKRSIRSFDDLGQILYDVAEIFCLHHQWPFAEMSLQLALQIAPALFEPVKFECLLHNAEQDRTISE